ncbi:UNVERIFIED_CONTAM: SprB repeat-containing protein, partial [Salmonella enterica subsp. enterica serovar Weltevreden]
TGSSGASLSAVRTAINTATNWNIQDVTLYTIPPVCTISISSPLSASATGTNVSCNGSANGRASVSATGGTPGYSDSWAPSGGTAALATGLAPGIYTVTVTDAASASVSATVMITQPPALTATTGFTNTSCNGLSNGRASVSASGGTSPYTYSW